MTPLVDSKACSAHALIKKKTREIILSSTTLLASFAILTSFASALQCGSNPAHLTVDSIDSDGQSPRTYYGQNTGNCSPVEFSRANIGGGTRDDGAGSSASASASASACPPNGGAVAGAKEGNPNCGQESPATLGNKPGEDSKNQPEEKRSRDSKPADFNRDIYYKNKLEFSLDGGWLPINIPLPFDFFSGDAYDTYPLKYTLVPIIASLRWHMNSIGGPLVLRGNWDFQFSGSVTAIPRGPETRYFVYIMGMRRNFVPRNWRVTPYFDIRLGVGDIDAKGPVGVYYAQGQALTFTFNFGSGVRYNFNSRYAISAGVNYMHISNANLSQPQVSNYGINVLGPMVGVDVQLHRHRRHSEHTSEWHGGDSGRSGQ